MTKKKAKKCRSNDTIRQLHETLFPILMDTMFGDGMERDYIVDGMDFKGLANMTDKELVQELEACGIEDEEDENYPLLQQARKELGLVK